MQRVLLCFSMAGIMTLCVFLLKMSWMSFLFDAITYSDLKCVLYFVKVNVMFCVEIKTFPLVLSPCICESTFSTLVSHFASKYIRIHILFLVFLLPFQ